MGQTSQEVYHELTLILVNVQRLSLVCQWMKIFTMKLTHKNEIINNVDINYKLWANDCLVCSSSCSRCQPMSPSGHTRPVWWLPAPVVGWWKVSALLRSLLPPCLSEGHCCGSCSGTIEQKIKRDIILPYRKTEGFICFVAENDYFSLTCSLFT